MSLVCHICHRQLFNFLPNHNGKTNFAKVNCNSITKNLAKNKSQTIETEEKLNEAEESQVCVTSCGHLFHRECLKESFNIRAELPINKKTAKQCPICKGKFLFTNCTNVSKDAFPSFKPSKNSEKLEDIMLKTQKMHEKLYILKKNLYLKQKKHEKILKSIEQIETSSGSLIESVGTTNSFTSTPPPTVSFGIVCPQSSINNNYYDDYELLTDSMEPYEDMRTKLLDIFSQSKEMERSMSELHASMSNFQYCLKLNHRTSQNYLRRVDSSKMELELESTPAEEPDDENEASGLEPEAEAYRQDEFNVSWAIPCPKNEAKPNPIVQMELPNNFRNKKENKWKSKSTKLEKSKPKKSEQPLNYSTTSTNLEESRRADFQRIFFDRDRE